MAILLTAVALLVVGLLGLLVFWVEPLAVLPVFEKLTPNVIYRVRTERPLVALSFDDGPHPNFTLQVLEILERYDAKATFFLIGERALRHPEVVSRIRAAGHEVGNHYFMNGATLLHSDADFAGYLEQTERAIGLTAGPKLFRPPGGVAWPRQLRLARAHGYECVLGCAYPHDPMHPPVRYIRWLIEKNLVPGAIVILHDGIRDPSRSIQALPHILDEGRARGLASSRSVPYGKFSVNKPHHHKGLGERGHHTKRRIGRSKLRHYKGLGRTRGSLSRRRGPRGDGCRLGNERLPVALR